MFNRIVRGSLFLGIVIWIGGCSSLQSSLENKKYQDAKQIAMGMDEYDVNEHLDHGATYLIEAARYNQTDIVKILLDKGAKKSIYRKDDEGHRALYYALLNNNIQMAQLLLENMSITKNNTFLYDYIKYHPAIRKNFIVTLSTIFNNVNHLPNYIDLQDYIDYLQSLTYDEKSNFVKGLVPCVAIVQKMKNYKRNQDWFNIFFQRAVKTKNYDLLNALSSKSFLLKTKKYKTIPSNIDRSKELSVIEWSEKKKASQITKWEDKKTVAYNFKNFLNEGYNNYITPNKVIIGHYNLGGQSPYDNYRDKWQAIVGYKKTDNSLLLKIKAYQDSDVPLDIKYNGMPYKKIKGGIQENYHDISLNHNNTLYLYFPKEVSVSKYFSLYSEFDDAWYNIWLNQQLEPAVSIIIPKFVTNIQKGKFESSSEFSNRRKKIAQNNEKKLNKLLTNINTSIQNYNQKLTQEISAQKSASIVNKIAPYVIYSVLKKPIISYTYDADKEIFHFTITSNAGHFVHDGKTFNQTYYPVGHDDDRNDYRKSLGLYALTCKNYNLTMKFSFYGLNGASFHQWFKFLSDYKFYPHYGDVSISVPVQFLGDRKTFNIPDLFYFYYNAQFNNIPNPCIETRQIQFHFSLPVKRKQAPAVTKLLDSKNFKPTILLKFKNNKFTVVRIKELRYPNEIFQSQKLTKVYDSIEGIKTWLAKYKAKTKLHTKAEKRLEELLYKKAIKTNSRTSLNKFKKMYPKSKYIAKINKKLFDIKKRQAMQEVKRNYFYNKWDNLYWDGKVDNQGWPNGKGKFHISQNLSNGGLFGVGRVTGEITINVTFKNHTIKKGKASAYLVRHGFFMNKKTDYIYSNKFNGVKEMNNAIIDSLNAAIREWNGKTMKKRHIEGSKCNRIYKKCMSSCNQKSSKGFFNDKDSCQSACIGGKSACERGDYTLGKMTSCRGICKGVSASDGDLFGWGASSFDKCVDSCTDRIGN